MDEARKEQSKLTATYMNGLAIAVFAVSGLGPLFTSLFSRTAGVPLWIAGGNALICIGASIAIHVVARRSLADIAL